MTLPGTMRGLTFGGKASVTIPTGAEVLSDPVTLAVNAGEDLAVSVYLPDATGPATQHLTAIQTNYVSTAGDSALSNSAASYTTSMTCWLFVDRVDVVPSAAVPGTVVAFGDSITDGYQSNLNANDRWPNYLGRRLNALPGRTLSVVDEGISGDQVLQDSGIFGVSALARLDRDVLSQPNLRDVILLEGINDIGSGNATAPELIAGYKQIIAQVHSVGARIFGATLTPFKGAAPGYWTPAHQKVWNQVNSWIRTSGAFDGVFDFAQAVANPSNPLVMNPAFDSGDHLHPNDAGYQAMANVVNLSELLQP